MRWTTEHLKFRKDETDHPSVCKSRDTHKVLYKGGLENTLRKGSETLKGMHIHVDHKSTSETCTYPEIGKLRERKMYTSNTWRPMEPEAELRIEKLSPSNGPRRPNGEERDTRLLRKIYHPTLLTSKWTKRKGESL